MLVFWSTTLLSIRRFQTDFKNDILGGVTKCRTLTHGLYLTLREIRANSENPLYSSLLSEYWYKYARLNAKQYQSKDNN